MLELHPVADAERSAEACLPSDSSFDSKGPTRDSPSPAVHATPSNRPGPSHTPPRARRSLENSSFVRLDEGSSRALPFAFGRTAEAFVAAFDALFAIVSGMA